MTALHGSDLRTVSVDAGGFRGGRCNVPWRHPEESTATNECRRRVRRVHEDCHSDYQQPAFGQRRTDAQVRSQGHLGHQH